MSTTRQEIKNIATGNVWVANPTLLTLCEVVSLDQAIDFMENVKDFAIQDGNGDPINISANSYKNKMVNVCLQVIRAKAKNDRDLLQGISWLVASFLGNSQYTFSQIASATESQKETFVDGVMLDVIELLAGVLPEEKTEYNSL